MVAGVVVVVSGGDQVWCSCGEEEEEGAAVL